MARPCLGQNVLESPLQNASYLSIVLARLLFVIMPWWQRRSMGSRVGIDPDAIAQGRVKE